MYVYMSVMGAGAGGTHLQQSTTDGGDGCEKGAALKNSDYNGAKSKEESAKTTGTWFTPSCGHTLKVIV